MHLQIVVLASYYLLLLLLSFYGLHRLHLIILRRNNAEPAPPGFDPSITWPSLAVQLPIYNEPHVVERLLDAAAALRYPGPLEIQILDDSNDQTSAIIASSIARWSERGVT